MKVFNLICLLLVLSSCFKLPEKNDDSTVVEDKTEEILPEVFSSQVILSFNMPVDARKEIDLNSLPGFSTNAKNLNIDHLHENSIILLNENKIIYNLKESYLNEMVDQKISDAFSDVVIVSFHQGSEKKILKINLSIFIIEDNSTGDNSGGSGSNDTGGGDLAFEDFNFGENPLEKSYQKDLLDLITKNDPSCNVKVHPTAKARSNIESLSFENTIVSFTVKAIGEWFVNISIFCEGSNELVSAKIFGTAKASSETQRFTVSALSIGLNSTNLEPFDKDLMDLIDVIDPNCEIEINEKSKSNVVAVLSGTLLTLEPIQNGLWDYDFLVKCKDAPKKSLNGRVFGRVLPIETSGGGSGGGGPQDGFPNEQ